MLALFMKSPPKTCLFSVEALEEEEPDAETSRALGLGLLVGGTFRLFDFPEEPDSDSGEEPESKSSRALGVGVGFGCVTFRVPLEALSCRRSTVSAVVVAVEGFLFLCPAVWLFPGALLLIVGGFSAGVAVGGFSGGVVVGGFSAGVVVARGPVLFPVSMPRRSC